MARYYAEANTAGTRAGRGWADAARAWIAAWGVPLSSTHAPTLLLPAAVGRPPKEGDSCKVGIGGGGAADAAEIGAGQAVARRTQAAEERVVGLALRQAASPVGSVVGVAASREAGRHDDLGQRGALGATAVGGGRRGGPGLRRATWPAGQVR